MPLWELTPSISSAKGRGPTGRDDSTERVWKSQPCHRPTGPGNFSPSLEGSDETELSSAQSAPDQQAWLPRADGNAVGARNTEPAAQERPQTADREAPLQARGALTAEGLPRSWRITSGPDLAAVLQQGQGRRTPRLELASRPNQVGHARLGVIVPRFDQTAVARNRLRRRLRELSRRDVVRRVGGLDLVLRARREAYRANPLALAQDIEQWRRSLAE